MVLQNNSELIRFQSFKILNLETERKRGGKCEFKAKGMFTINDVPSRMAINIWVAYFWRGKKQTTKLDSVILFVIENKMFLFIGL